MCKRYSQWWRPEQIAITETLTQMIRITIGLSLYKLVEMRCSGVIYCGGAR